MFKKLGDLLNTGKASYSGKRRHSQKSFEVFDFLSLVDAWESIVGEKLSKNTIPLKNTYKTLTILTRHSAFSSQLSFMEPYLIKKIEEHFPSLIGKIKKIQFMANSTIFDQKKSLVKKAGPVENIELDDPKWHPYSPHFKKIKNEGENLLEEIDDEYKEKLLSIFMQMKKRKNT